MRNNKGFSLIELMIVVAIIAILAAIAVPNYMQYSSKTRRTEAKYNLEAIYKAQISWFGEYNVFSNSFNTIRWRPEGTIYYFTFWAGAAGNYQGKDVGQNPDPGVAAGANSTSFTAYGWGNIDSDSTVDIWYINDRKDLVNTRDDLSS